VSAPLEFIEYQKHLRARLEGGQKRRRSLRLLSPPLSKIVLDLERSKLFTRLAARLLPTKGEPKVWAVSEILRRSGFYQDVVRGQPPSAIWRRIERSFLPRQVEEHSLLLLDGCRFPFRKTRLFDVTIERLPAHRLTALCPRSDVREAFFDRESLDPSWFSQQWFLHYQRSVPRKPGNIVVRFNRDLIGSHWKPLLTLALFDSAFFQVPIWLESEPGWQLRRIAWSSPMTEFFGEDEIPATTYEVGVRRRSRFLAFVKFAEKAINLAGDHRFRLVARRFLRAMLVAGPIPSVAEPDEYEEALLQYVYALETLLLLGDREAIADKLALRAAYLVGLDNEELRSATFSKVKHVYGRRSEVVHGSGRSTSGGSKSKELELEEVRELTRRVL